jgi:hypothetical protein
MNDVLDELLEIAEEAAMNVADMDVPLKTYLRAALAAVIPEIAKAERERCAAVCDARYMGDNNREDQEAKRCAAAIRALDYSAPPKEGNDE